jgi:hypothetical protein
MGHCMSCREIKIDVWKYICPILMGLGAVLEKKLDDQDRALRRVVADTLYLIHINKLITKHL